FVNNVGSKKNPFLNFPLVNLFPPAAIPAPLFFASSTCSNAFSTASESISGPISTWSSLPSPILKDLIFFANKAENSSAIDSCTYILLAHTQVCPAFLNLLEIPPSVACSKSASSNTINGACPPNSIDIFFIVSADCFINCFPTSVEPVKVILRTSEESINTCVISLADPCNKLTTPLG